MSIPLKRNDTEFCRVFQIDISVCEHCGGKLNIIAAITGPPVISRILAHLGLPTRAPPRAPSTFSTPGADF